MRLPRTLSFILALLLAAALPLRGYAAMALCEGSASTAEHAGHGHHIEHPLAYAAHCTDGTSSTHSGGCSDCCCAAAASTPSRWALARAPTSEILAPALSRPPSLALDRLDRPPRPRG